jgi:hypothetical protein
MKLKKQYSKTFCYTNKCNCRGRDNQVMVISSPAVAFVGVANAGEEITR